MTHHLRLATPSDAGAVLDIYRHYVLYSTASYEYEPPTLAEMEDRIAEKQGVFPWLLCMDEEERLVGYAYGGRYAARRGYDWCCETSVYIDKDARQGGIGRTLYTALLNLLRAQGYRTVIASVTHPNPASHTFHVHMGFVQQGLLENIGYKFGKPLSVAHYSYPLAPVMENPPLPVPLDQLPQDVVANSLSQAVRTIIKD